MVTISPTRTKRRFFTGIRWRILLSLLLIVGLSFAFIAPTLTGLVSNYLYTQRIREDSLSIEKLATAYAPLFVSGQSAALHDGLTASGGELGGRLLVIDQDGKVQSDSFDLLCGSRLQLPQVLSVLTGGNSSAWGMHRLGDNQESEGVAADDHSGNVSYCAAALTDGTGTVGVLLYIASVETMMTELERMELRIITYFIIVAVAAMALAFFVSRLITRPISAMTGIIRRMGQGDLSVRMKLRGSGELREMAESYNTMAQQLETLDKSRNQFVSNASHELKTPLTTMKILLESMMYQPDMPQQLRQEFMGDMNHEIDRLTGIITDLLTLTQMDNNRMELHTAMTNLSAVTEETLRLLAPMAQQRHMTLRQDIQPNVAAMADGGKIGQVIYNLAENAIKYTPDGGKVSISMRTAGDQVEWRFRDNGVGISEKDQAHIFERFYRVDKARSRETGGTGLGLSIVRQMLHLHGGEVSVESEPGKGSTFIVTLPMKGEVTGE